MSFVGKPGWFPEGGPIDKMDKFLSSFIFRLELGKIFEFSLSVPGMWFGVPLYALLLMPTFVALFACHQDSMLSFHNLAFEGVLWRAAVSFPNLLPEPTLLNLSRYFIIPAFVLPYPAILHLSPAQTHSSTQLPLLCLLFLFWMIVVYDSVANTNPDNGLVKDKGKGSLLTSGNEAGIYKGGFNFAYAPGGRKGAIAVVLFGPHLSMALVMHAAGDGAWRAPIKASLYYLLTWMSAQIVVEFLKATAQRARPVVALPYAVGKVKRHLRQISSSLTAARSRRASFPSGDVAGAMAFSGCAFFLTGSTSYIWFSFAAMSAFGRMYFHARKSSACFVKMFSQLNVSITYRLHHQIIY